MCGVLNISKAYCYRIVSASLRFATTQRVCGPLLCPRRSLTVSAMSRCRAATDSENDAVAKKRTVRWLPRKKKGGAKRKRWEVAEQRNVPSMSVLVDMLACRDSDSSDRHNAALNTVRTEIDEKLKELDEVANIQIRDIHLAMEMEDEEDEKTEVSI